MPGLVDDSDDDDSDVEASWTEDKPATAKRVYPRRVRAAPDHNRGYKYPGGGLARQGMTAAPAEGQETQWPQTFKEALAYPGTSSLPYEPGDVLAGEPWRATRAAAAVVPTSVGPPAAGGGGGAVALLFHRLRHSPAFSRGHVV